MTQPEVDPLAVYPFVLRWKGEAVAAVAHAVGPMNVARAADVGPDGAPACRLPEVTSYRPLFLSRGIMLDRDFVDWAKLVWTAGMPADEPGATGDLRRDLVLEQRNAAGQVAIAYRFPRCWPSELTPLPELDAEAGVVALASLTLQHEGGLNGLGTRVEEG